MLKCRDVVNEASHYLDHGQPWTRRLRLQFHLFICIRCRRFVRHLRLVRGMIARRGPEPASPAEVERIVAHCCKHP